MKFSKVRKVKSPERGTEKSAGIDFFVPEDLAHNSVLNIPPGGDALIPSGIKVNIPEGFMLMGADKSGVCTRKKLIVGAKIVDEDYQGEMHIHVINVGNAPVSINFGDKIAQFIIVPVSYVQPIEVSEDILFEEVSQRGAGGFGSTGTK